MSNSRPFDDLKVVIVKFPTLGTTLTLLWYLTLCSPAFSTLYWIELTEFTVEVSIPIDEELQLAQPD